MILDDDDLAVEVTYRKFVSQDYNESLGYNEDIFSETTPTVARLRHTVASALVGVGDIQAGDQVYMMRAEDAPSGMSLKDEIINEDGETQKIKDITPIFGLAVLVTVEAA